MFYPGSTRRRPPAPHTPLARPAASLFPLLLLGGVALTLAAAVHRVGVREARRVSGGRRRIAELSGGGARFRWTHYRGGLVAGALAVEDGRWQFGCSWGKLAGRPAVQRCL